MFDNLIKKNACDFTCLVILKTGKKTKPCGERGSNTRPSDLQSDALPTELSPLPAVNWNINYKLIN